MKLLNGKIRMFCLSNIIVSFVCTGFLGTTYCNTAQELGHDNQAAIVENDEVPLSQKGETKDEKVDVIDVPDVKEIDEKTVVAKKTSTTVVNKKEVKSTTKYTPAKYNAVTGQAIVDYAKKYLGLRYVSGGFSLSTGTDCSGFTKLIYREFGITLSRSVVSQAHNGSYVQKSDLQKGDLVFYGNGNGRVSHVGIYIGNGKVLHESNPRSGVKISPVNMMQYITARRVINSKANEIVAKQNEEKLASENANNANVTNDVNNTSDTANSPVDNNVIEATTPVTQEQGTVTNNTEGSNNTQVTENSNTNNEQTSTGNNNAQAPTDNSNTNSSTEEVSKPTTSEEPKETVPETVKTEEVKPS